MLDDTASIRYNITGYLQTPTNVFHSNRTYFAGAAVLQIFSILAILYTFYGWWNLGWRSGSLNFSPLELAKAFDAPLLRADSRIRNGGNTAKHGGDLGVQLEPCPYRDAYEIDPTHRMVFVETDRDESCPTKGRFYGMFRTKLRNVRQPQ